MPSNNEIIEMLRVLDGTCKDESIKWVAGLAADTIEELCRKEKFHAFIWNTLGNDKMRLLIDAYREQEETE